MRVKSRARNKEEKERDEMEQRFRETYEKQCGVLNFFVLKSAK
jgi:hypothetical protein